MNSKTFKSGRFLVLVIFGFANLFLFQNCSKWEGNVVVSDRVDALGTDEQLIPISNPNYVIDHGVDDDLVGIIRVAECLPGTSSSVSCANNPELSNKLICKVGKFIDENGIDDCLVLDAKPCSDDKIFFDGKCVCSPEQQLSNDNVCYTPAVDICADVNSLKVTTATITFEENTKTCAWNSNANYTNPGRLDNNKLRARFEQFKFLSLPKEATVCSMNFDFNNDQEIKYDDHVILTYNDYIFATTQSNFLQHLENKGTVAAPLYLYNWLSLVGDGNRSAYVGNTSPMCLDVREGSQCNWPLSEQRGTIMMTIDPGEIQRIADLSVGRSENKFGFITVGDNDLSDCKHLSVSFVVRVEYAAVP